MLLFDEDKNDTEDYVSLCLSSDNYVDVTCFGTKSELNGNINEFSLADVTTSPLRVGSDDDLY